MKLLLRVCFSIICSSRTHTHTHSAKSQKLCRLKNLINFYAKVFLVFYFPFQKKSRLATTQLWLQQQQEDYHKQADNLFLLVVSSFVPKKKQYLVLEVVVSKIKCK